jgi:hypothetical protein
MLGKEIKLGKIQIRNGEWTKSSWIQRDMLFSLRQYLHATKTTVSIIEAQEEKKDVR